MAIVRQRKETALYLKTWQGRLAHPGDFYIKFGYVLLHQIDLVLTVLATSAGFSEMNPVMLGLLSSPLQLVLAKLCIPLLIAWLVPGRLLAPAALFLLLVVCWNLKELFLLVI